MDSDQRWCRIGCPGGSGVTARIFFSFKISFPPVFRRRETAAHDTEQQVLVQEAGDDTGKMAFEWRAVPGTGSEAGLLHGRGK